MNTQYQLITPGPTQFIISNFYGGGQLIPLEMYFLFIINFRLFMVTLTGVHLENTEKTILLFGRHNFRKLQESMELILFGPTLQEDMPSSIPLMAINTEL